jgi:hypothetical protein
MPAFEFKTFLTIWADDVDQAKKEARDTVNEFSCSGEFSFSLDDSEPVQMEDD